MEHLTQRDLRALLDFLHGSYCVSNSQTFAAHTVRNLLKLIPSELAVYSEMNLRTTTSVNWGEPRGFTTADTDRRWERVMQEHPMFTYYRRTRDGRAYTISDFLPHDYYRRLSLYNEFYRVLGVEEDLNLFLAAPSPIFIGISLHRGWQRFSARDCLLLNLLRPHLSQAWHNARAFTELREQLASAQQALDRVDRGVVAVDANGRVRWMTPRARQSIHKYFGNATRPDSRLPEILERWVKGYQSSNGERRIEQPRAPFIREGEDGRLVVRLLTDAGQSLLLFEEHKAAIDPAGLAHFGLTLREAEVLAWVARGKTNPEIASILGRSPRTVQKHLEHIFQKLGVETRTAAAARALEQLRTSLTLRN